MFYRGISAVLITLSLFSALPASAAPVPAAVAAEESVTLGEFTKAAVDALALRSSTTGTLTVKTLRPIPPVQRSAVMIAVERQALGLWTEPVDLRHSLTRGEALFILMKLTNIAPQKPVQSFADAPKDSPVAAAIETAIEQGWVKKPTTASFGTAEILSRREFSLLLSRIRPRKAHIILPVVPAHSSVSKADRLDEQMIVAVWKELRTRYLYDEKLDAKEAGYRAIEAMVSGLNDPYTSFLRPQMAKEFQTQLQGEIVGIGAQVEIHDGVLTVISPLTGSPAERAGVLPGDQIVRVNGEETAGMDILLAVSKIRGKKGSTVSLTIRRNGGEIVIDIVREQINLAEIEFSRQGDILVVKLLQFGETTERDLRGLLSSALKTQPRGLVLDLRNNPGGLLDAATKVVSNFLPKGSTVARLVTKGDSEEIRTSDSPTLDERIPMVVLINKGSASASEIVAGALQDAKRATIVGEQSFGKGTAQQILGFKDGSNLKMTFAEWKTPNGRAINKVGVEPDEKVAKGDARDEQMLIALQLLR